MCVCFYVETLTSNIQWLCANVYWVRAAFTRSLSFRSSSRHHRLKKLRPNVYLFSGKLTRNYDFKHFVEAKMQWMFRKYFIWKPMDFSVSRVQFGTGVQQLVERAFNRDGEYICYCRSTQVFCIHTHGMFDMYVCGMRIYTWRSVILRLCAQTTEWQMSGATHIIFTIEKHCRSSSTLAKNG